MGEAAMAVAENGFVTPEAASPGLLSRVDGCVLPFLGGFGKYQKRLVVLTWIPALFLGFSQFSDQFLLAQPDTCVWPTGTGTNSSGGGGGPRTSPALFAGDNVPYVAADAARRNVSTGAADCACMNESYRLQAGLTSNVVTKFHLVCDSARIVHFAKFSLIVGSIFGFLVLGVLADWFGRHPVLIVSVFFMLVFGLTVAFSINMAMFSTLRFFEGFCLAGIILSLYVLRIELCLPDWRFSMTMVATFVLLGGQLLMPGLAIMCGDWQVLQAVIICPLLLMLTYVWLFPESLRWLLATQQFSRAKRLITQIDKKNAANLEKEGGELLIELQQALQKKPKKTCIVKMVGTRNLWKNIVVLCVNSLTGYGIHHCFARSMIEHELQQDTMFQNFYAQYYTMAGIAVASCLALCPAVGMMGRRGGLLMFMIITALASLLQLGLLNLLGKYSAELNIESTDDLKSNFSVVFSIIGMFSSHAVSNLSIFFCAEITPTVIRGGGLGLVLASAGFGMLTAPIMELHNQKGYFLHHVIFACCTLICIICILLLPETRYQPLPESLADGESYTRQPLLPPRKPGEQRLLLTRTGSRVYDRVQDTPPHGGAAATINSTASSAVDLTLPSGCADEEMPAPDATPLFRKEDKPATTPTTERPTSEPNEAEHPAAGASELTQLTSPMDTSSPLLIGAVRPSRLTNQTPPTRTLAEAGSPSPVPPPPLDPTDSSLPAVDSALHVDSTFDLSPTAETTTPLLHAPQPPAPVESSTHILPDLSRDPAAVLVNGLVPSSTEGSGSPVPDSLPPIVHTPPPVLPATPSMIPSVPPPVSSSNADSAPETEESSPLVGAAPPSTVTLSTSLLQDSIVFSGTDPLPVPAQSFSLDCTVSSPIDSGLSVAESSASS